MPCSQLASPTEVFFWREAVGEKKKQKTIKPWRELTTIEFKHSFFIFELT